MSHLYLKPNVVFEPLYDNWYAWPHLISPATAAMNFCGRHLAILDDYISDPSIHELAIKTPEMKGGPFVDIDRSRRQEIVDLRQQSVALNPELIEFVDAIKQLDKMLAKNATGYSLNSLYDLVPEILRGYIELFYDLNNNPSYRIIESLLYKSEYYKESLQSVALWVSDNDERPFVLSTPRTNDDDAVRLNVPFKSEIIDTIAAISHTPQSEEYILELAEQLKLNTAEAAKFLNLFTSETRASYQRYNGEKIRMRYFGHACILVETSDVSILVDPVISYYGYETDVSRMSFADLPEKIDYVLITHNHQDHILFETLLPLRHRIGQIVVPRNGGSPLQDPNLRLMFNNIGFQNIIELNEMETVESNDLTITGLPFIGEHSDLNIQTKLCHHVKIGDFSLLFAADSCNVEPMIYERLKPLIGDVDVLFLGMECDGAPLSWLYGPLLTEPLDREMDRSRRLAGSNFEQGKHLVDLFGISELYVYAMGQEPWLNYIMSVKYTDESNPIIASNKLIAYCEERGINAERLFGEKELLYNRDKMVFTL
jgi:L-ascorbate metabolism protein UlaG (beta-lactamase superfamily)